MRLLKLSSASACSPLQLYLICLQMLLNLFILAYTCWSLRSLARGSDVDALSGRGSIYFEDSDITVSITTPNGKKIAEAFNATTEVKDPQKMRWVSLGLPLLLVPKDQLNITKIAALKFASGGFYIFIKTLSSEVAQELAKEASQKYGSKISMSQFIEIDKHIGSVECSLELFVNDTVGFIKFMGNDVVIANPIVMFFKLPSPVNSYVKIIRNETNPLIFRCNIELHGRNNKRIRVRQNKGLDNIGNKSAIARSEELVNSLSVWFSKMSSGADKESAVFTERISLTTEDLKVADIVSECAAAIKASALSEFTAVLNATASIRDSMNQSLTAINQMARNTSTRIDCAFAMSTRDDYMLTMLQGANLSTCSGYSIPGGHSFALYTTDSIFTIPPGVRTIRALAVGGGGGGASGCAGGGGSGYVRIGEYNVTELKQIRVTVGRGGRASTMKMWDLSQNGGGGGRSSLGSLLYADGAAPIMAEWNGGNGGSGGGICCVSASETGGGGKGGSDGESGFAPSHCSNPTGWGSVGTGQGSFSQRLRLFSLNNFTAGSGGSVSLTGAFNGGGGGGGVLMNGEGPSGGRGQQGRTFGGNGYGGGGAGGTLNIDSATGIPYYAGGDGADGLVYIEW